MRQVPFALLLLPLLAACGGPARESRVADPVAAAQPPELEGALAPNVTWTNDLLVPVDDAAFDAADGQFVALVPAFWPADGTAGPRPIVGSGVVHDPGDGEQSITLWDIIPMAESLDLHAYPVDEPAVLDGTKRLARVESVNGRLLTIAEGQIVGVEHDDIYFVLNAPLDTSRLGGNIGAMAVVTEASRDSATLRVEHADVAVEAGDLVLFAQSRIDHTTPESTLLFAPMQPGTAINGLHPLASALPGYMAEYGITNISLGSLPDWLDPVPWDAPRTSRDVTPDTGFGGLVFGQWDPPTLLLNVASWGESPQSDGLVGILPGGLPVDSPDGMEALSAQLAPSFLANMLAQRGDHAIAAYLLESVLRNVTLQADVRFHLREHLALRWRSLGNLREGASVIDADVRTAREDGLRLPLLNALSIQYAVESDRAEPARLISILDEMHAASDGVLPPESMLDSRLSLARHLEALGDPTVDALRDEIYDGAVASGFDELAFAARVDQLMGRSWDPQTLRTFAQDMQPWRERVETSEWLIFNLLLAIRWNELGESDQSDFLLAFVHEVIEQEDLGSSEATIRSLFARVLMGFDRTHEAIAEHSRASQLYLETLQYTKALENISYLAAAEFALLPQLDREDIGTVLQDAQTHMLVASRLALTMGSPVESAWLLHPVGILELRTGATSGGLEALEQSVNTLLRAGQLGFAARLLLERAEVLDRIGQTTEAAAVRARAEAWSER